MNRICALLAAAILWSVTTTCTAGEILHGMLPAQTKDATAQPEPAVLPPPITLPAEPEQPAAPSAQQPAPRPPVPAAAGCCNGGCPGCCERLIEWLTYRPLNRCGPCGCFLCPTCCCTPPLYTYFLTDCAGTSHCGHCVATHAGHAGNCKTCEKPCKSCAEKQRYTGLLFMMRSCN